VEIKIIYQDESLLVVNKPSGVVVYSKSNKKGLIDYLLANHPELAKTGAPPRYGLVHRLDKETSGVILVAKNKNSLRFLQKQFKKRKVIKKYRALVVGKIEENNRKIETLIGRSPSNRKKQKVFLPYQPKSKGKRKAITKIKILKRFAKFALLQAQPITGRMHQIRVHLSYINHPIAGDKKYGFKNQPCPKGLNRLFLHAYWLKIKTPKGKTKAFKCPLPNNLKKIIKNLNKDDYE